MPTIVIIDDDVEEFDDMRNAVLSLDPGSMCTLFDDATLAVEEFKTSSITSPAFIFLDVNMKKMDGEECLKRLRELDTLRRTRIIMMSSSMKMYEQKLRRLLDLGADGFAEKPDNLDDYAKMFQDAISQFSKTP